ncbi:hypothetical protein ACWCPX_39390 [Streptomyces olivaceoviridis]
MLLSAPSPTGPEPEGRGLEPPAFGRPSPALLARAGRGYTRFPAHTAPATPDDRTGGPDDAARRR